MSESDQVQPENEDPEEKVSPQSIKEDDKNIPKNEEKEENLYKNTNDKKDKDAHHIPKTESKTSKKSHSRKKSKAKDETCEVKPAWNCDDALWRIYMTKFAEDINARIEREKEQYGEFGCIPRDSFPRIDCVRPPPDDDDPCCYKLNAFNLQKWKKLKWKKLKCFQEQHPSTESLEDSIPDWPKLPPCISRDFIREEKIRKRKEKMKEEGALQCDIDEIDSPGTSEDEELEELAKLKELDHARIPITDLQVKKENLMVDKCCGAQTGLVYGDYIYFEFESSRATRSIAYVTLHGLTGMHIAELERTLDKAWKFDLFQALVALMVKTQLKYTYVWSPNIDYIYNTAWHIFKHVGFVDAEKNLRFDDILIYNYIYSVEIELIDEFKDGYITADIPFKFFEKNMVKLTVRSRKELTLSNSHFGEDKEKDDYHSPVHRLTRDIEKWFDQLDSKFTNCIMKTPRFAVAFWKDVTFWYLYNPYRCDKLGFFTLDGHACLSKHCSKEALKRHLMVLLLRGYAYSSTQQDGSNIFDDQKSIKSRKSSSPSRGSKTDSDKLHFYIRIYQVVYHSCHIHNIKLYTRKPRPEPEKLVAEEKEMPCPFNPLENQPKRPCDDVFGRQLADDINEKVENHKWLKMRTILWVKKPKKIPCPGNCEDKPQGTSEKCNQEEKWHNFEVLTPQYLYVLWGNLHIVDTIFPLKNRYNQSDACYAVCAGMIQVHVPEYWTSETLDAIVICGDRFYSKRSKKVPSPCEPHEENEPPYKDPEDLEWDARPEDKFVISGFHFNLKAFPTINGHLYSCTEHSLWDSLEELFLSHNFGILSCENAQLGVFKQFGAYYILDVRTYGPPVYELGTGGSYLLRATCFREFIICLILIISSPECSSFQIRPIDIVQCVDTGEEDICGRPRCPDPEKCGAPRKNPFDPPKCPREDECKKRKKKNKNCNKFAQKVRHCCG